MPLVVKVTFHGGSENSDIRRLSVNPSISWDEFLAQIKTLTTLRAPLSLQYDDNEGDKVTMDMQQEWTECLRQHDSSTPLRIYVGTKSGYAAPIIVEDDDEITFACEVNQGLQVFVCKYSGSKGSSGWCTTAGNVVKKVDIEQFVSFLHEMAFEKAVALQYKQAMPVLQDLKQVLLLCTEQQFTAKGESVSFLTDFNLACVYCQLGKLDEACDLLTKVVAEGWCDTLGQLVVDDDLKPLRKEHSDRWAAVLRPLFVNGAEMEVGAMETIIKYYLDHGSTVCSLQPKTRQLQCSNQQLSKVIELLGDDIGKLLQAHNWNDLLTLFKNRMAVRSATGKTIKDRTYQIDVYDLSCGYAQVGDFDRAFQLLNRIVSAGFADWDILLQDEDFKPLHKDNRWPLLLDRKGKPLPTEEEIASSELNNNNNNNNKDTNNNNSNKEETTNKDVTAATTVSTIDDTNNTQQPQKQDSEDEIQSVSSEDTVDLNEHELEPVKSTDDYRKAIDMATQAASDALRALCGESPQAITLKKGDGEVQQQDSQDSKHEKEAVLMTMGFDLTSVQEVLEETNYNVNDAVEKLLTVSFTPRKVK